MAMEHSFATWLGPASVPENLSFLPSRVFARVDGPKWQHERIRWLGARIVSSTNSADRARAADALCAIHVGHADVDAVIATLELVSPLPEDPELRAPLLALAVIAQAMLGQAADELEREIDEITQLDTYLRAIVEERLTIAAFYRGDVLGALRHGRRAIGMAEDVLAFHVAAAATSALYATHYHLTGNFGEAAYYADRIREYAGAGRLPRWERWAMATQLDLAVVFGDVRRTSELRMAMARSAAPEQMAERLMVVTAEAITFGWAGDFIAMRRHLDSSCGNLTEAADLVYVGGLRALADAALGEDDDARRDGRKALSLSTSMQRPTEKAYLLRRRRLGRILAAYAAILIGDIHRGRRALANRTILGTGAERLLAAGFSEGDWLHDDMQLTSLRGYVMVAQAATVARATRPAAVLTPAEREVLEYLAHGYSGPQISKLRKCSAGTIQFHVSSILGKLNARNRTHAVALARELAII